MQVIRNAKKSNPQSQVTSEIRRKPPKPEQSRKINSVYILFFVFVFVLRECLYTFVFVFVFSLGDNVWKNIQRFPENYDHLSHGVHLSGSINWLTLQNYQRYCYNCKYISVEQFIIISLDLHPETYKEIRPPRGFVEVPLIQPSLCVLMDCLCFCNVVKVTQFVIWKMTEYGVEESWTQLLKINLQIIDHKFEKDFHSWWVPLHVSKNCDTMILANYFEDILVVYNLRDDSVERARITNSKYRLQGHHIKNYAESLVLSH